MSLFFSLWISIVVGWLSFIMAKKVKQAYRSRKPSRATTGAFFGLVDRVSVHPGIISWAKHRDLRKKILAAGLDSAVWEHRFCVGQQILVTTGFFFSILTVLLFGFQNFSSYLLASLCLLFGSFSLLGYLYSVSRRRQRESVRSLQGVLDGLRAQSQAGVTLEQSIGALAKQFKGVWGIELGRAHFLLTLGLSLKRVLDEIALRLPSYEVNRLVMSLQQSLVLGMPIAQTLKMQSDNLRIRRKQAASKRAHLSSIYILMPLMFCIFPALLLLLLGPFIIKMLLG